MSCEAIMLAGLNILGMMKQNKMTKITKQMSQRIDFWRSCIYDHVICPSLQSQENYRGRKIMNKSSNYESASNFDYQEDFTQFLEEARKKACKWTSNAAEKEHLDEENKKSRKSWKNSLFSWLKKADHKRSKSTSVTTVRRGHVSGPVNGTGGGITGGRAASSGPITGVFSSTMVVEEYEVPYTCLDQLNNNNTRRLHSYGPVYFVT